MISPTFQLTVRAAAAVAVALAGSFSAVPALADAGGADAVPPVVATPSVTPSPAAASPTAAPEPGAPVPAASPTAGAPAAPAAPAVPRTAPEISDAGLAEALRRDLGMTLEEFNAAGQLARTAADALPSLRDLPGYVGISLQDNRILVEGSGAGLQARVDELNSAEASAVFVLVPPASGPAAEPTAAPETPEAVPSAADRVAASTEQLFRAYVREVGTAGLQAVVYSGGSFIIRAGGTNAAEAGLDPVPGQQPAASRKPVANTAGPGKISPAEFVARYANVRLEKGARITPEARTAADIFGGQGYVIPGPGACSAGFSAFGSTGDPAILTAGHCSGDGTTTDVAIESLASAPAAGAPLGSPVVASGPLGTFGFSQFGGPGNSAITGTQDMPGNIGTDIAVIKGLGSSLRVQPAATKWDDIANPGSSAVKIIGTMAPFAGQTVCRSGRTTGWKCGTVDSVGIWAFPGPKSLPPNFDNDLRAVRAFDSTSVKSNGGDSGGPWISGNFAVGTHTGTETEGRIQLRAIATTLADALSYLPDVQLHLFLNKPELAAPAGTAVRPGQPITGRVPAAPASAVAADSKVRITVDGGEPVEVPVDAAGNWTYPAPEASGPLTLTAETVNGFSRSGAATLAVTVSGAEEPVVTPPAEDVAPVVPAAVPPKAEPAAPVLPAASGHLPDTGAGTLLPTAGLAAGAILLGAALLAATRRRSVKLG